MNVTDYAHPDERKECASQRSRRPPKYQSAPNISPAFSLQDRETGSSLDMVRRPEQQILVAKTEIGQRRDRSHARALDAPAR